jgi:hypothetical protein
VNYGCNSAASPPKTQKWLYHKSFGGYPEAIGTVVNFKEVHVFEKLLRNFSKTCTSKEFYLPPQAAI